MSFLSQLETQKWEGKFLPNLLGESRYKPDKFQAASSSVQQLGKMILHTVAALKKQLSVLFFLAKCMDERYFINRVRLLRKSPVRATLSKLAFYFFPKLKIQLSQSLSLCLQN